MAIRIRRAQAKDVREPVVQFFWKLQAWPFRTLDEYFTYWDWRYTSLSESEPVVWVAMDGDSVVGHIAVNFRKLRAGDLGCVRVGVAANFRVDESCRNSMIGARLAGAPRALVREGDIAMLLGYGNDMGHAMFVGLGFRDLGAMQSFVDVRRWRPILARRFAAASALAPLAHLAAGVRKVVLGRGFPARTRGLVVRDLSIEDVLGMDRSHWSGSTSLVSDGSPALLANRFLRSPYRSHHVFGVMDERTHRLQGLVVTEGESQVKVWECEVNESALSEEQAVGLVFAAMEGAETGLVPLLPGSTLAEGFTRAGFFRRAEGEPAPAVRTAHTRYDVEANTWWSAYSEPGHPFAALLEDPRRWKVWYAWSHH
jgi:hypothetical protein